MPKPIEVREPPAFKVRTLAEKLRDLQGEAMERAEGARIGSALLAEHNAFPEAARFLDGLSLGMSKVAQRLKIELDDDEVPF